MKILPSDFDINLSTRDMWNIVDYLPKGFSGANFETCYKFLCKLRRPEIRNAQFFRPVNYKGHTRYEIVKKSSPGAKKMTFGKDLVYDDLLPQKISKSNIYDAIDRVYVQDNADTYEDLMINFLSKL